MLVAWVPFRAESLEGAVNFYTNMLSLNNGYIFSLENTGLLPQELFIFLPIALIIVFFFQLILPALYCLVEKILLLETYWPFFLALCLCSPLLH